eukprot:g25697.t1
MSLPKQDTCDLLSLENILLYITVALSVTAVVAIIMFLAVDYLRRLAIHAAQRKGYRLTMEPKELRQTGLGIVILLLALVMLLLYACVIIKESQGPEGQDDLDKFWVFVEIAAGGATLVIFYQNLRGLHRSPKMQFDSARHGDHKLNLQQFLNLETQEARDAPAPCSSFARALQWLAGDLAKARGIGAMHGEVEIPSLELRTLLNPKPWPKKYVFLGADVPAKLQVRTSFHKTSKVRLCCGEHPCSEAILKHKLIKLFDQPVDVDVPHHLASNCTLSLKKLISPDNFRNLSGICVAASCDTIQHTNGQKGSDCGCADGFVGDVKWDGPVPTGACIWEPCAIENSTFRDGNCTCMDGFVGQITWESSKWSGWCRAAECKIPNSNRRPGKACKCKDGFLGSIDWDGGRPIDKCDPAPCDVNNSNQKPGPSCQCEAKFVGGITWNESVALPSWWASTFEGRAARANDINIDELAGCKLTHYQNGTCYQVVVSSTVHIFQSEEGACPRAWGRMEDAMEDAEDEFYKFAYSSFGTQTYENPTTHFGEVACSPFAMRRQLQLEIQEVHNGTLSGAVVVADMETPCRKVLRFVMDASRFLLCQHIMDEEWEALMNE